MDPMESVKPKKDSTLAMMQAAQKRDWDLFEIQQSGIFLTKNQVFGNCRKVSLHFDQPTHFEVQSYKTMSLEEMDVVLFRKDPPFNMEYLHTTYLLEVLEKRGVPVLNKPSSIRDCMRNSLPSNSQIVALSILLVTTKKCCEISMMNNRMLSSNLWMGWVALQYFGYRQTIKILA